MLEQSDRPARYNDVTGEDHISVSLVRLELHVQFLIAK